MNDSFGYIMLWVLFSGVIIASFVLMHIQKTRSKAILIPICWTITAMYLSGRYFYDLFFDPHRNDDGISISTPMRLFMLDDSIANYQIGIQNALTFLFAAILFLIVYILVSRYITTVLRKRWPQETT